MNKKAITILVLLAVLALPMAAMAATEFSLGGYVKMEVIWDSTQVNKNLLAFINRNNDANFQHGRLKFTAENTRMSFTVKGPKVFGAASTAYIEWDFDNHANEYIMTGTPGGGWASPNKARLGVRHAFFKLNWPETELLMGAYWSVLTEEVPETANFGACTTAGQPFLREPQIRLTQTAGIGGGKLTASLALAAVENGLWGIGINQTQAATNAYGGESTETPKVEGRIKYDIDLWGKAAFWGVPRPFSIRAGAAWWKERFRSFAATGAALGRRFGTGAGENDRFMNVSVSQRDQQYLDHWLVEGSVFIPLIPTHSANLAGTMSLLTQWWVGAGLDGYFEDFPNGSSYLNWVAGPAAARVGDRQLLQRYGGFIQLQYYFTNQWYANAVWGINRAMGVDRDRWMDAYTNAAANNDPVKTNQHFYLALWYRPIQALKFGLEYTYVRTDYFQQAGANVNAASGGVAPTGTPTSLGENHRVLFCGFLFF